MVLGIISKNASLLGFLGLSTVVGLVVYGDNTRLMCDILENLRTCIPHAYINDCPNASQALRTLARPRSDDYCTVVPLDLTVGCQTVYGGG